MVGKPDMKNIIRLQLALMRPHVSDIKIHVDTGGYATYAHRLHIPLMTNAGVRFDLCPFKDAAKTQQVLSGRLSLVIELVSLASFGGACSVRRSLGAPLALCLVITAAHPQNQHPHTAAQVCYKVSTNEGFVFELNNKVPHRVSNNGDTDRVHVVVDIAESPRTRIALAPGATCDYDPNRGMVCGTAAERAARPQLFAAQPAAAAAAAAQQQQQQQHQQAQHDAQQRSVPAGAPVGVPALDMVQPPAIESDDPRFVGIGAGRVNQGAAAQQLPPHVLRQLAESQQRAQQGPLEVAMGGVGGATDVTLNLAAI